MRFRPNWLCLNGEWEFATDRVRIGLSQQWFDGRKLRGKIVVPFTFETQLSGRDSNAVEEVVWYARSFEVPSDWRGEDRDILLHFGAVDYRCTIWINGVEIGHNQGGHVPFAFDVAPFLRDGENRVAIRVEDPLDPYQPRGKQSVGGASSGIHYTNTTGIWQTVWLEGVPSIRIEDFIFVPRMTEDSAKDSLNATILVHAPGYGHDVLVEVLDDGEVVGSQRCPVEAGGARLDVSVPNARRWSPDSPHLYDVRVTLLDGEKTIDQVTSYTGFRKLDLRDGKFILNGEPIYLRMVLDQGYWPDGGMTAPSDEALRADVEWCKKYGFNGARKHQKAEDPRWLYWCDKLGLLVWGEMANAWAWSPAAEEKFLAEWERAVRRDINHPCIVTWVPLNESWGVPGLDQDHPGQYAFVERVVSLTRRLDGTRPVVDNDGWEHTDVSDIFAIHDYTQTGEELRERYRSVTEGGPMQTVGWGNTPKMYFAKGARYRGQPVVLSEVGGFLSIPPGAEKLDGLYSVYGVVSTDDALLERYADIMDGIGSLPFVAGFCYTQLTDVEQEKNGLLTYDRQTKVDPAKIAEIHAKMGQ